MRARTLIGLCCALFACASDPAERQPIAEPVPIELQGNEGVSTRKLKFAARRELQAFAKHGRRAADLEDAAYSMELELRRSGYAHAKVAFRMEPSEAEVASVVFLVEEGALAHIGAITFPGAAPERVETLHEFFPSAAGVFGNASVPFQQSQVDSAVGEIERLYLLDGYRNVRVGPAAVTWNEELTIADIVVPVTEGARYSIESIEVVGEIDAEMEKAILTPLRGQGFYLRMPKEAAARMRAALMDRGHQDAVVKVETTFEESRVTLRFVVEPGPVFRIGNVNIVGEDRTKERFIRSRIPLKKGAVASESKIQEGVDNLYRTGVMRSVEVRKEHGEDEQTDLEYAIDELMARSVSFEVGWGSYELLRGGIRYQDRNFLGYGRRLDLEANASTKGYGLVGSIADNYLLGQDNTLRLSGGVFQREEPSFTRFGYDAALSVTHRTDGPWLITTGYTFDAQEARDIKTVLPDLTEGEFVASAGLFANVSYDTRDNSLLPTRGSIGEAGLLWSSELLGADLNYIGIRASWFSFFKLTERMVIGTGVRFESRPILDDRPTLPIQKRLFLGGAASIRSFDQSELGPFDRVTGEPLGGLTSASAHVELRTHVWRELHLATFAEVGMVSPNSLTIEGPPGSALGAGLRYYLPVGPIRIDVAYNPGELFAADSRWQVHFAFGFSF
ncbi:MAG: BamA/OMP85 family outer membrane protein [Planctomycetota bacterium]|jgi:outer membrane protein assembly complex protein YaeT